MITNEVLHDSASNDWSSSVIYYEGQKISTSVQFWAYTIQGIRADMFNILPEKIAVKALHEVLKISMDTLTVRYCQLEPAAKRLTQYRDACNARPTKSFREPPASYSIRPVVGTP
jgi:hypothetical protein